MVPGTVLNHVYARAGVPEVQTSKRAHLAVVGNRLYFRSPDLVAPLCMLAFDTATLELRDRYSPLLNSQNSQPRCFSPARGR
jgi:hypothetical protein